MKTNITYIISNIDKALAFEWVASNLNKEKYNLNFILLNPGNSKLESYLIENNIEFSRINYSGKKNIIKAVFNTFIYLKKNKTNIVHTHLFDANIIGLTAAWLARIPKRIYTRHHSTYHHTYYPKAVKYDKLINYLSTDIIAISRVVEEVLMNKESVPKNKISVIYHGFQLDNFQHPSQYSLNEIAKKYNPNAMRPVIGVISRYIELKGIQFIIPAFKNILNIYPNALLLLANANGDYKPKIKELLQEIPKNNFIEISFEENVFTLYKLFDVFIHVPINGNCEAFGQTYVEALAAGIPSVFTLSGIANEFIKDKHNALVVPFKDSDAIFTAVRTLLENKTLAGSLINNGTKDVNAKFSLKKMILSLEQLYQ